MTDSTKSVFPVNLKAGYLARKDELDAAVQRVLESGWYIGGAEVDAFEAEFAEFCGVKHAIGVATGTDALVLALRACGIGPGDIVLTVSHTAVATVAAVELAGAEPRFVDIDPATFTMCPTALAHVLDALDARGDAWRIKAVIPVHIYGRPADMPRILRLTEPRGLNVIEDCAQAHGAALDGRLVGTWGRAATFSFYPTKNLGAFGDGGAVVTDDAGVAENVRLIKEYGWRERYISEVPGMNSRLDPIQAGILRVNLSHLNADNARRRTLAAAYRRGLGGSSLVLPREAAAAHHVYHQFVVRHGARAALRAALRECRVGTLVHYPAPVHLQPAYRGRIPLPPAGLPHTEAACREVLSLPIYPALTDDDQQWAIEAIKKCIREQPGSGS